jgi:membrane protein DedA with SNARE-associated domain
MNVNHLISTYGYSAVFVIVGAESVGVPLPGETALIAAGTYAGRTHRLSAWLIFAVAVAAAIIGPCVGFWIGEKGGYRLIRRYGPRIGLDERKLKAARYVFDTQGTKVVFFGRFVSILRTYAAFLAGANRMRWSRFLPANVLGAVIWAAIFTLASYQAGNTLRRVSGTINLIVGAVAVLAIVAAVLVIRRQTAKIMDRAEAAYPGPLE